MKTSEYLILMADSIPHLQARVSDKVKEGFEPVGGLTFLPITKSYIQAVFKKELDFE